MPVPIPPAQAQDAVRDSIRSGAALTGSYLVMNILAAIIASYGLFANSPAVVIGAMIVAMLLGPIAGVALALVDSDMRLLIRGLGTLLAGAVSVLGTALLLGLVHRDLPVTPEMLARTTPNVMDLMIALAGGAAGAYATVTPRLSVAFVGVAIATALVPPLSTASLLWARGAYALGLGAFVLAVTNMVAIQFASSVVLWLSGFRRLTTTRGLAVTTFVRRNSISLGILAVLAVLLTDNLQRVVAQQLFETRVRATLRRAIEASAGSYLADVRFAPGKGTTVVRAVLRGPNPPSADDVAALEARLPLPPNQTTIALRLRFVHTTIMTRHGSLYDEVEFTPGE